MERLLYNQLERWKASPARKPLILNGARQVGKTWLLQTFGATAYDKVAYVNFERLYDAASIFSDFNIDRIIRALSALTTVDITPGDTLIILDEIQEFPRALTALKYFCEDAPQYHIAVAGSLLGVGLHEGVSFPVGKVDELRLYPLTFVEFLMAMERPQLADALLNNDRELIMALPQAYIDLLRQYMFTGGMPAVVLAHTQGAGPVALRRMQKQILSDYRRDFSKHAAPAEVPRINLVWDSIPMQLARENKKFRYSDLKKGGRASEFVTAIQWLVDAGLVYRVSRISEPKFPLRFYEVANIFKLFLLDVGLLGALADAPAASILAGDSLLTDYKGAFTEEYVLSQLVTREWPIYYFATNDSQVEVDFVIQTTDRIVPIEVKAGENVYSKSLRTFVGRFPELKAIRFSMLSFKDQQWMENIPLYAVETACR